MNKYMFNKYVLFDSKEHLLKAVEDYCTNDEIERIKRQIYLPVIIDDYIFAVYGGDNNGIIRSYRYDFDLHTPVPNFNRKEFLESELKSRKWEVV